MDFESLTSVQKLAHFNCRTRKHGSGEADLLGWHRKELIGARSIRSLLSNGEILIILNHEAKTIFLCGGNAERYFWQPIKESNDMPAGLTELQQKQLAQMDVLLEEGVEHDSFAKDLFFGRFRESAILPFPEEEEASREKLNGYLDQLRDFCRENVDPAKIEAAREIPTSVIDGLAKLGVFGMTADESLGGQGKSLNEFCEVMEVLGAQCAATSAFVTAQHSAGLKALELFATEDQKIRWYQAIASGEKKIAFALTETMAGSDINNVRTRAEVDGEKFSLTGEKRWITNAAKADVLIVMARTPDHGNPDGAVTAFLVTPDSAGFEITEKHLDKIGINGISTGNFKLNGVSVDSDDVLGELGGGMEVANTVLAYSRLSAAAASVGAASYCIDQMVDRAKNRHQFGLTLAKFGMVQEKIAIAAADCYAMESANRHLAGVLAQNPLDCEIEGAMIKVFSSTKLWEIVDSCIQIWGGAGVFKDQPFERMLRDARVNLLGDCANDALRSFIAMIGFRHVAKELVDEDAGLVSAFTKKLGVIGESLVNPTIPVKHEHLKFYSRSLSRQIGQFSWQLKLALSKNPNKVYSQQHIQGRLADIAIELFTASCVFARISDVMVNGTIPQSMREKEFKVAQLYLSLASRRNERRLEEIKLNCDNEIDAVAQEMLSDSEPKHES